MSNQPLPPPENNSSVKSQNQENGFANLIFNFALPIFILNNLSKKVGPLNALILALIFPLAYGIYDLVKRKKTNYFSILGLLNVLFTGGLALFKLDGIWFAVKEAAFPALVGIFVFASSFTRKPFIETLFLNPALIKLELLETRLHERGLAEQFHQHMRSATRLLTLSFVLSAVLNFALARYIFIGIDPTLSEADQSIVLNEQIGKMTMMSLFIIMIPSILFLLGVFWYLLNGIKKYAGLSITEVMKEN